MKITKNKNHSAFTLVELIVVIVILAILATIAFLSFSSQSGGARDSTRLADISSIKKGFEMYNASSGTYPTPDNGKDVTYSGGALWTQGTAGSQVFQNINKTLSKKVSDPLSKEEYAYSLASNGREYQVAGNLENPTSLNRNDHNPFQSLAINYQLSALGGTGSNVFISGNFNGVTLKAYTGSTYYIVASPTMILYDTANADNLKYENDIGSGKLLLSGINNYAKFNEAYVYSSGALPTDSDLPALMDKLQLAYSGSNITDNPTIQQIIALSGTALADLGRGLVKNSLGGSISSSNSNTGGGGGGTNSCNSTTPANSITTAGSPSSANQAWQNTDSANACYFKCNAGYGWNGTSCVAATSCTTGLIEMTLDNGQVWSCMNLGATTVWDGSTQPTNCAGGASNCNSALTWLGDYYQWGSNDVGFTNGQSVAPYSYGWESQNDNKWGGSTTTATAGTYSTVSSGDKALMKGPCPAGSHVPTAYEWQLACDSIIGSACSNGMAYNALVATKLRLSFAGYRNWSTGYYNDQAAGAYYWSSSPSSNYSLGLTFIASNIYPTYIHGRANSFTVRCLKN